MVGMAGRQTVSFLHRTAHSTAHTPQPTPAHSKTQARSAIWAMGKGLNRGHLLPKSGGMGKPKGGDSESNKVQYSGVQHSTIVYTMLHMATAPSPAPSQGSSITVTLFLLCMRDGCYVCMWGYTSAVVGFLFLLLVASSWLLLLLFLIQSSRSDQITFFPIYDIRTTSPPETLSYTLTHQHTQVQVPNTPQNTPPYITNHVCPSPVDGGRSLEIVLYTH